MTQEFKEKLIKFITSLSLEEAEKQEFLNALNQDIGPELMADFGDLVEKAIVGIEEEYQDKISGLKKEMDGKIAQLEKQLAELKEEGKKIIKQAGLEKDQQTMEEVRHKISDLP